MHSIEFLESKIATPRSLKLRTTIYGIGINDAPFCTQFHHEDRLLAHPAYMAWKSILCRCYDDKYLARFPTYKEASVCDEWRNFMAFRDWWLENQVDGWVVDKDILAPSKIYSPETCIFIPSHINIFLTDSAGSRGKYPVGCSMAKSGKFVSYCNNPFTKTKESLGTYGDPESAHQAWKVRKIEHALTMRNEMDAIDLRIYPRVVEIVNGMR